MSYAKQTVRVSVTLAPGNQAADLEVEPQ